MRLWHAFHDVSTRSTFLQAKPQKFAERTEFVAKLLDGTFGTTARSMAVRVNDPSWVAFSSTIWHALPDDGRLYFMSCCFAQGWTRSFFKVFAGGINSGC